MHSNHKSCGLEHSRPFKIMSSRPCAPYRCRISRLHVLRLFSATRLICPTLCLLVLRCMSFMLCLLVACFVCKVHLRNHMFSIGFQSFSLFSVTTLKGKAVSKYNSIKYRVMYKVYSMQYKATYNV